MVRNPAACVALSCLLLAPAAMAQVTPASPTPVFPAPAPPLKDTLNNGQLPKEQEFATPSVVNQGPTRGLIFHYERMPRFGVTSTARVENLPSYSAEANKNARLIIKGYAPLLNNPHLKLILGINYEREEFEFRNAPTNYELYDNIEDKGLKTLGAQLAVIRPVNTVNWYIFRIKGELSGDYTSDQLNVKDYLRVSSEFLYGWKRSPEFSWGIGVQLGYTFGRFSPYPAVLYNRTFNSRWGLEAIFPARVAARYNISPRSILTAGYTVDGYNYIIKLKTPLERRMQNGQPEPGIIPLRTLELRETEVKLRGRWERELYDFIWLGVEGGYRYNYSFDAFDKTNDDRQKIIDSQFEWAPYASLEIFIVPTKGLLGLFGAGR
jgi:hypothetical protein